MDSVSFKSSHAQWRVNEKETSIDHIEECKRMPVNKAECKRMLVNKDECKRMPINKEKCKRMLVNKECQ